MNEFYGLPDKTRKIVPPQEGWEPEKYYACLVAIKETNLIHKSIFFSGKLRDGEPGGYNQVWNPTYSNGFEIQDVHYLEILNELDV